MGLFGIFLENAEQRSQRLEKKEIQQLADSVWKNYCRWHWMTVADTKQQWLTTGELSPASPARFNHPSAYSVLNRYPVVDLWVERLAEEANACVDKNDGFLEAWCSIEHDIFWKELTRVFSEREEVERRTVYVGAWTTPWPNILNTAGLLGNLAPFHFCPRDELVLYTSQASMCHPKVGLWLHQQGLFSMNDLRAFVNESTMPMTERSWRSFAGSLVGEPIAPEYVVNWCKLLLSKYELPIESKVRVIAHAIYSFGFGNWIKYIEPTCAQYLDGIELPLVYAVCGKNTASPDHQEWQLYQTVVKRSQTPTELYDATKEVTMNDTLAHPELTIFFDLMPPQDRIGLYFLACSALQVDKGLSTEVDILELPSFL